MTRTLIALLLGASALTACAAAAKRPLVARNAALAALPGPRAD